VFGKSGGGPWAAADWSHGREQDLHLVFSTTKSTISTYTSRM